MTGPAATVEAPTGADGAPLATAHKAANVTRIIGVQSGNAVDGLDVGIFDFRETNPQASGTSSSDLDAKKGIRTATPPRNLFIGKDVGIAYTTLANKTYEFTGDHAGRRDVILKMRTMAVPDGREYAAANYEFGRWLAECINKLIEESGIPKDTIDFVSSHGQTICGHPHWEIGDLNTIAQLTGITCVGDFRTADVAAGGNGTPCTCTYDSIMLRPKQGNSKWRVAINIGGTSSVTFLPPWGETGVVPVGLDPGLGVFFMDLCVRHVVDPSLEYDPSGNLARSGKLNEELLDYFLTSHKYFQQRELPIGVGPDDFPETLFHEWNAKRQEMGVSGIDFLNTLTELTCKQIALACKRFGGEGIMGTNDVIMRGGVCYNTYYMERLCVNMNEQLGSNLTHELGQANSLKTLEQVGLNEDSWENAMYALFGYLCVKNICNFVPSCTGADYAVVGGKIAPGANFTKLFTTHVA